MKIVGAGLAGLLAANMLRHKKPIVFEEKSELPNNHSAVLRFRSHIVGDVTGIDFKKVSVIKASMEWMNPVADALAYAEKCTGTILSNRSIPTDVQMVERYIAPSDLIQQLSMGADIVYSSKTNDWLGMVGATISTIPMPLLMDILHYEKKSATFGTVNGTNIKAKVSNCDAYVSLYVPSPSCAFSRISLTGDELIVEFPNTKPGSSIIVHDEVFVAAELIGIKRSRLSNLVIRPQTYAKIQEIDEGERKRFIAWATDTHNIYSLGRFACWRPGTLLDDLVQDVRLIERWIKEGTYTRRGR